MRKNRQKISNQICVAQQPKSLAVTKISKISESPDIWVITILREPQRHIKFSTNFAVTICRNSDAHIQRVTVWTREKRKSLAFSLFCPKISMQIELFSISLCENNFFDQ